MALLAFVPFHVAAHGEATLSSPSPSVVPGMSITLNGAGFAPGEVYQLVLRGPWVSTHSSPSARRLTAPSW
jgi:hypothetical protein